ncbi:MAG: hypothetical protein M1830_000930, partial [Pleopsidium flavum]
DNPSLHYAVWQGRDGKFVIAGRFEDDVVGTTKAINLSRILEMWTCCMFRSLPKATLDKYSCCAPIVPFFENNGLNIANPLWGAQQYKLKAIEALKDSPEPEIRAYLFSTKTKRQVVQAAKRRGAQLENALGGGPKTLGVYGQHCRFGIGCLQIVLELPLVKATIWGLKDKDEVNVDYDLVDVGRHPHAFAPNARNDDPGARLGIRVRGTTARGEPFTHWIVSTRDRDEHTTKKADTIVDWITEVPLDTALVAPRRFLSVNASLGRPKAIYT